jgi:hypothetical protein
MLLVLIDFSKSLLDLVKHEIFGQISESSENILL